MVTVVYCMYGTVTRQAVGYCHKFVLGRQAASAVVFHDSGFCQHQVDPVQIGSNTCQYIWQYLGTAPFW